MAEILLELGQIESNDADGTVRVKMHNDDMPFASFWLDMAPDDIDYLIEQLREKKAELYAGYDAEDAIKKASRNSPAVDDDDSPAP